MGENCTSGNGIIEKNYGKIYLNKFLFDAKTLYKQKEAITQLTWSHKI